MQMEVIPSPQATAPINLHTITSQTWDLNILGYRESHIEYIPVYMIVMLCCWASSSQHFKDYSVFVFRVWQAKNNS